VKVASKCCLHSKRGKVAGWKLLVEGTEMGALDSGNREVVKIRTQEEQEQRFRLIY
jgi:hypothetical protein